MFDSNDKDRQAEFFSDLPDTAKETKKRRFLKGRVAVSLSQENLIFFAIGLIMLLIVCYSWGVERGKNLAQAIPFYPDGRKRAQESEDIQAARQEQAQKRPTGKSPEPEPAERKIKTKVAFKGASRYTIQVATLRKTVSVKQEIERLKDRGYYPFIVGRGKFSEICVGNYKNKNEASVDLEKLRKLYADCFTRNK